MGESFGSNLEGAFLFYPRFFHPILKSLCRISINEAMTKGAQAIANPTTRSPGASSASAIGSKSGTPIIHITPIMRAQYFILCKAFIARSEKPISLPT